MEDMSNMDSGRMKQLMKENEELKKKLETVEYQKDCFIKTIMNKATGDTIKDTVVKIEKMLDEEKQELKKEIADLKEQLSIANKREQEIERLNGVIADLEEKLSVLKKGRNWEAAVNQNVAKSMEISAHALCYAVKGCSVKEIVEKLDDIVTERTVYRAISVKEDTDLQRITTILHQYRYIFESYEITEDEVLKWFEAVRAKKRGRIAKATVVQNYDEW